MGRCLDEMGRQYIRELVSDDKPDDYVRREIKRLLKPCESNFQYEKNKELIRWMRNQKWPKTAEYLENYVIAE